MIKLIPGARTGLIQVLGLILVLPFLFGAEKGPAMAGVIVAVAVGYVLLARRRGPKIVNADTKQASRHTVRAIGAQLACVAVVLVADNDIVAAIVCVVTLLYLVWVKPSQVALLLLIMAALVGDEYILIAAPVTVMLARRDSRLALNAPRSIARTVTTIVLAVAAFAFTLPFAKVTAGSPRQGRGARPVDGEGPLTDALRWLFRYEGAPSDGPGRPVWVPAADAAPPDDDPRRWLWILAVVIVAALVAFCVFWWKRCSAPQVSPPVSARPLARLESIGKALGRERAGNEGAITYAAALGARSGDGRLAAAGGEVSGELYLSGLADTSRTEHRLDDLEARPPAVPRQPLRDRMARAATRLRANWRPIGLSLGALGLVVAAGFLVATRTGNFDDAPEELAFRDDPQSVPAEYTELLASDPASVVAWESCSADRHGEYATAEAGLARVDRALAGHVLGGWSEGYDDAGWQSLRVGTDTDTWYTNTSSGTDSAQAGWTHRDVQNVSLRPFGSIDDVLALAGLVDPTEDTMVDRFDRSFVRFESRPTDLDEWERSDLDRTLPPVLPFSPEYQWVLDVWTDDAGIPVRLRTQIDDPSGEWSEWRRVVVDTDDVALRLPQCPAVADDAASIGAGNQWLGPDGWTPIRSPVARIATDAAGHPYPTSPWDVSPEVPVEVEAEGSIDTDISSLHIGEYTTLIGSDGADAAAGEDAEIGDPDGSASEVIVAGLDWTGASMLIADAEGWPVGVRLDRIDNAVVDSWDELEPLEVYESFLTVSLEPDLPTLTWATMSEIVDPLWTGADFVTIDRSGSGRPDTYVLTASEADSVSIGRSSDGTIVSVAILANGYVPWRRFGFEGTAPPSVLTREAELQDCLDGHRALDRAGYCT